MRIWALAALLAVATPATAQEIPPGGDEGIKAYLATGEELESHVSGDLNGDGKPDRVMVGIGEDRRVVQAVLFLSGGPVPVGTLKLDAYPLGPATLSLSKGVLKIEDLTGGTTAVNAVYRYRLVPGPKPRMRLIGIDATLYSRTYAHDGHEISWNLLTGNLITREMKLNKSGKGEAAYGQIIERKRRKPSKPLYMEDTPDPNALLGWGEK